VYNVDTVLSVQCSDIQILTVPTKWHFFYF